MPRGRKVSPEQSVVMLRQIEVQLAQGMSLALACKDAGISEQTRDRSLARPLQSGAAACILGLPTARPRDRRRHPSPPVQGRCHALTSISPVQNPGQVTMVSIPSQARVAERRRWLKERYARPSAMKAGLMFEARRYHHTADECARIAQAATSPAMGESFRRAAASWRFLAKLLEGPETVAMPAAAAAETQAEIRPSRP